MEADYTDDIALLAYTPTKAESLLHSLKQATGGIGLYVNANKMEYICFNKKKRHLHTKWWFFEIRGQVHVPWKQHLIY